MSVYIIVADKHEFAKIGYTKSPMARLEQLQIGSPHKLRIAALIPAGPSGEQDLHKRLGHLHHRGEWFRTDAEITSLIDAFGCDLEHVGRGQNRFGRKRIHHDLPRGVRPHRNRFQARIRITGRKIFLGSFLTAEEAGAAYASALDRLLQDKVISQEAYALTLARRH